MTINELVKTFNYKKLPNELSQKQREIYKNELPSFLNIDGDLNCKLYYNNIHVSNGYNRIVIGDYGAYIEIAPDLMIKENIKVKPGQEYRFQEKYKNVKYRWYCLKECEDFKIYYQVNTVTYADYRKKMCYISPSNIQIIKES